jgi:hypothetical protein
MAQNAFVSSRKRQRTSVKVDGASKGAHAKGNGSISAQEHQQLKEEMLEDMEKDTAMLVESEESALDTHPGNPFESQDAWELDERARARVNAEGEFSEEKTKRIFPTRVPTKIKVKKRKDKKQRVHQEGEGDFEVQQEEGSEASRKRSTETSSPRKYGEEGVRVRVRAGENKSEAEEEQVIEMSTDGVYRFHDERTPVEKSAAKPRARDREDTDDDSERIRRMHRMMFGGL